MVQEHWQHLQRIIGELCQEIVVVLQQERQQHGVLLRMQQCVIALPHQPITTNTFQEWFQADLAIRVPRQAIEIIQTWAL